LFSAKDSFRNIDGVKDCFKSVIRVINADQPLNDIYTQVYSFTAKKARSVAPRTPRIVILGPTGSGRKTVAAQVSRKYDIPISKKNYFSKIRIYSYFSSLDSNNY
jgi:hypothetical protein